MFNVPAGFVAVFKIGDNINFNLETLRLLYELIGEDAARARLLRKSIIVTLVSIAEAMLYDFIVRIQSREHVSTVPKATVAAIREKNYSQLANLVSGARKYDLFEADDDFYDQVDELRKLRNRVHIQNEKEHFERDESAAFTAERQLSAEKALEYICKFLSRKHQRASSTLGFVRAFEFPWHEHYD